MIMKKHQGLNSIVRWKCRTSPNQNRVLMVEVYLHTINHNNPICHSKNMTFAILGTLAYLNMPGHSHRHAWTCLNKGT